MDKQRFWWLTIVGGMLVGFVVGRHGAPGGGTVGPPPGGAGAGVVAPAHAREAEFPAGWLRSADLASVAGVSFAGLGEAQKAAVMQALNSRDCQCGCGKGSVASCAKNDAACPRSPRLTKEVVELARKGSGLQQLLSFLDRENPASPAAAPSAPKPGAPAGAPPAVAAAGAGKKVALAEHHPRKGPRHAKVTLVEFSDFQCPYCSRVVPLVEQITAAYPKDVAFVFVNLPLRSIHPQAADAAKAFLAAYRQGAARGWRMHDRLFANQKALMPADLERHARDAGLDVARWKRDMADPALDELVAADEALAMRLAVSATPTFHVNGRELSGGLDDWKGIVEAEIARADALLAKGVKLGDLHARFLAEADKPLEVPVGASPSKGPSAAPVTIVAFSEFQCPFCARALPALEQVEQRYRGKVRIAFKHLLIPGHEHAPLAAEASLAAHEQGKFWPYHDKLFKNQKALDRASLERYAAELALDMRRFKSALDSGKHRAQVQSDMQLASRLGASATPTFFVNGRKVMGAKPFEEWRALLDEELTRRPN